MHLSDREAAATLALMAMYADEHVAAEEDATLRARLSHFPLFEELGEAELGHVLANIERRIRKDGREAMYVEAVRAIEPWLRPTTFLIAAEIVAADGNVELQESKFLHRLRGDLAISEEKARQIFEITKLRLVH